MKSQIHEFCSTCMYLVMSNTNSNGRGFTSSQIHNAQTRLRFGAHEPGTKSRPWQHALSARARLQEMCTMSWNKVQKRMYDYGKAEAGRVIGSRVGRGGFSQAMHLAATGWLGAPRAARRRRRQRRAPRFLRHIHPTAAGSARTRLGPGYRRHHALAFGTRKS